MATRRTLLSAAALLLCSSVVVAQTPANDACANTSPVGVGVTSFDNTSATLDGIALNPAICVLSVFGDDQIYNDVWFSFTPPADGAFDFSLANNGANPEVDSRIALYDTTVCPADPLLVINCNDDSDFPVDNHSRINHYLTGGTTYTLRIGVYDPQTPGGPQDLVITDLGPEPANDDCGNATVAVLGLNAVDTRSASDGTGLALDPMICDMGTFGDEQIYNDVWLSFTPATTDFYEMFVVNNNNTDFDSRIAVYDQSTCPDDPANVIACNDNIGAGFSAGVQSVSLTSGSTYLVRVGCYDEQELDDAAAVDIRIGSPPTMPPANDDCANAAVAVVGSNPFDSSEATDGTGLALNPAVCDMGMFGDEQLYQDVWWTFTPGTTGSYNIASINNGGLSFDSRMAIYDQASCPDDPANVIACDEDSGPFFEADLGVVLLNAGTTYTIRVGSYGVGGSSGVSEQPAVLSIALVATPPANDFCANAIGITAFGNYPFDSTAASTDGADLTGFCDFGTMGDEQVHRDVWFSYTPTIGGCTYISTLGFVAHDTRIAVYNSSSCPDDPLTVIACSDEEIQPVTLMNLEAGLDVELAMGSTYLIRVGSWGSVSPGEQWRNRLCPDLCRPACSQQRWRNSAGCARVHYQPCVRGLLQRRQRKRYRLHRLSLRQQRRLRHHRRLYQ